MIPTNPIITLAAQGSGAVTKNVRLDASAKGVKVFINLKSGSTGTNPAVNAEISVVPLT